MDLQQSQLYQQYIAALGWSVETIDGSALFYRSIPFVGTIAKIQRPISLPYLPKLIPLLRSHHVKSLSVEPRSDENPEQFSFYIKSLSKFFPIISSPFLPTKTIFIDVSKSEKDMFSTFTSAKRRAVRRAEKNGITITSSNDITDLTGIKNKSAGMFGGITTYGIDKLWNIFYPKKKAHILLAKKQNGSVVAGVLLLLWEKRCHYWIAGATKEGKKLFAPTLLVWEALQFAHKQKCQDFDFVGVWDERTPKQYTAWKGFTKFKEGFGGITLYYPISTLHKAIDIHKTHSASQGQRENRSCSFLLPH
ncbi:MAG: peptidoglycan bridge formation glycyltransferase FemA/FemB family protein [Candidatus Gottesmanbacteria bacterium]